MGMAVHSTFKYEQKLTLNYRLVVGTGHTGGSLRNLPFKVWKALETCRPRAICEGRECRNFGLSNIPRVLRLPTRPLAFSKKGVLSDLVARIVRNQITLTLAGYPIIIKVFCLG